MMKNQALRLKGWLHLRGVRGKPLPTTAEWEEGSCLQLQDFLRDPNVQLGLKAAKPGLQTVGDRGRRLWLGRLLLQR